VERAGTVGVVVHSIIVESSKKQFHGAYRSDRDRYPYAILVDGDIHDQMGCRINSGCDRLSCGRCRVGNDLRITRVLDSHSSTYKAVGSPGQCQVR